MAAQSPFNPPIALVTGVGDGLGASLAIRLAKGGYKVAILARDLTRLQKLVAENVGLSLFPFSCDMSDEKNIEEVFGRVVTELGGSPSVLMHNAVSACRGAWNEITTDQLRMNFEVNTVALLKLVQLAAPKMVERGSGAILATGNTGSYRGKPFFTGYAPTKAGQRILMEAVARDLGPKGVHACYLSIDAVIQGPFGKQFYGEKRDEFFCKPDDIAEEAYRMCHQARSAWVFDAIVRPFGEPW
jgi:short-subunit dehydrogenase